MSFAATTPKALRLVYANAVRDITPTHDEFQDSRWSEIVDEDPRGADLRTFRILTGPATIVEGGFYCGELCEVEMEMRVRVSYADLLGNTLTDAITRDGLDLWAAFHDKPGGSAASTTGLISYGGDFFVPEPAGDNADETDSETTSRMVDFVFFVRFTAEI